LGGADDGTTRLSDRKKLTGKKLAGIFEPTLLV